jgi:hypothetical protein
MIKEVSFTFQKASLLIKEASFAFRKIGLHSPQQALFAEVWQKLIQSNMTELEAPRSEMRNGPL